MIHASTRGDETNVELSGSIENLTLELLHILSGFKNKLVKGKFKISEEDSNKFMTDIFFKAMTMDDIGEIENDET